MNHALLYPIARRFFVKVFYNLEIDQPISLPELALFLDIRAFYHLKAPDFRIHPHRWTKVATKASIRWSELYDERCAARSFKT